MAIDRGSHPDGDTYVASCGRVRCRNNLAWPTTSGLTRRASSGPRMSQPGVCDMGGMGVRTPCRPVLHVRPAYRADHGHAAGCVLSVLLSKPFTTVRAVLMWVAPSRLEGS